MNFQEHVLGKLEAIERKIDKLSCLSVEVAVTKVKLSGINKQLKVAWTMILLVIGGFVALAFK